MPNKPVIVTYAHRPKRPPRKRQAVALQVLAVVTRTKHRMAKGEPLPEAPMIPRPMRG
jgi:hypothetical protein